MKRVEKAAAKVPGVATSAVNFATESLTVEPSEGFSAATLAEAIRKAGYEPMADMFAFTLEKPTEGRGCGAPQRGALICCRGRVRHDK